MREQIYYEKKKKSMLFTNSEKYNKKKKNKSLYTNYKITPRNSDITHPGEKYKYKKNQKYKNTKMQANSRNLYPLQPIQD